MFGRFLTLCMEWLTKDLIHISASLTLNKSFTLSGDKSFFTLILWHYFLKRSRKVSPKTAVKFQKNLGEVKVKLWMKLWTRLRIIANLLKKLMMQNSFVNLLNFFLQFEPNNKRTNKYFKLHFAMSQFLLLNLKESCILQCIFHYI